METGLGISPGIALGRALVFKKTQINFKKEKIEQPEEELNKFLLALSQVQVKIEKLIQKTLKSVGKEEAAIFESHLLILQDPEFISSVENKIFKNKYNSHWSVTETFDEYINVFSRMDSNYMKERTTDLRDLQHHLLEALEGVEQSIFSQTNAGRFILVSEDLTPSDSMQFDQAKLLGFATEKGGKTSHTAILARSKGIPAVAGIHTITEKINDGDFIIIDGNQGEIYINPEVEIIDRYEKLKLEEDKIKTSFLHLKNQPTVTASGVRINLSANVGTLEGVQSAIENGAEGIGLFRTEFLYMQKESAPTEDEQFEVYKSALISMNGKKTVIRTLDIGGDKEVSYLKMPPELNPFLGDRAIRYCLKNQEIFKTQLRALLRASRFGNLWIMIPMITTLKELLTAKAVYKQCQDELGGDYADNIKFGIMIEVPAAALISDELAKHVDFFSIGTNDLTQYTLAVDRLNESVADLYNSLHPAVLKLIAVTVQNAQNAAIPVSVCGEMASQREQQEVLLELGITDLSMTPAQILPTRAWLKSKSFSFDFVRPYTL